MCVCVLARLQTEIRPGGDQKEAEKQRLKQEKILYFQCVRLRGTRSYMFLCTEERDKKTPTPTQDLMIEIPYEICYVVFS